MTKPLRLLVVEDSEEDTGLVLREMVRGGYEPIYKRVSTAEAMREALASEAWEIILADYTMPHFSGVAALVLLKKSGLDLPFIIVSGSIGEDAAVAAMKAGANDYVMKTHLSRLVPAVERELREAEVRRERRLAETRLAEHVKEIEVLNDRLAEQQAELATFHDLVTHDVSNFSMTLMGIMERLLTKVDGPLTPKQEEFLRRANRQGLVVSRLAENAKMLARLRRGGVVAERTPVPLADTLGRAVETMRAMHYDREFKVSVVCPEGLAVAGFPFLENVFLNLLDNAVRHTSKDSTPIVRVGVMVDDSFVRISFRDGERLEEEVRLHLFERYRRGTRSTSAGLGLAVVREIIEGLGGKVNAGSPTGAEQDKFEVVISLPRI
jgi:signal transduction histidine kinase